MDITVSRRILIENITGTVRKYCIECRHFFEPLSLEHDPHATHYSWFLPMTVAEFDSWLERIRQKDELVWGYLLDEDGTRSRPFCPSEFTLTIES
jgi:hypothetical protein